MDRKQILNATVGYVNAITTKENEWCLEFVLMNIYTGKFTPAYMLEMTPREKGIALQAIARKLNFMGAIKEF